ncbi:MAG: phosphatidylglycerol lysyltransferase domain-containing protein [Candidatus Omnitrophica bacterium]|nr:phosphatidylglycerol lysyltransferase domain-containing protein [Candidatus Omnitrophota bacterium]
MNLRQISLNDKRKFREFLGLKEHRLSVYSFENIYIWKGLFEVSWAVIRESLCVFFRDKLGCFVYLEPLSGNGGPQAAGEAFKIMDKFNRNKDISRLENIEEDSVGRYLDSGYACVPKFEEYVCDRKELAGLQGNPFKSKRAAFNYFIKHYKFEYLPFSAAHKDGCLRLYAEWAGSRTVLAQDPVYKGMQEDSLKSLEILLSDFNKLDVAGRLVKIDGKIKAFTFGFALGRDTFCVLYEITDLSIKGLSQFIFRNFCEELKDYRYINIMDDSGLENLKKVKLSYHPVKLVPSYIVKRRQK